MQKYATRGRELAGIRGSFIEIISAMKINYSTNNGCIFYPTAPGSWQVWVITLGYMVLPDWEAKVKKERLTCATYRILPTKPKRLFKDNTFHLH
jgi:hypothetical protein